MKYRTIFWGGTTSTALAAIAMALWPAAPIAKKAEVALSALNPIGASAGQPAAPAAPPFQVVVGVKQSAPGASKAAAFAGLARSGSPADAFGAYQLAAECLTARRQESQGKPADAAAVCGDISPGQITARLPLLELAASVGVPGAFESLVMEGPTGDGFVLVKQADEQSDPVAAAYIAKLTQAMEAAAKAGNAQAAASFSNYAERIHDMPTAVAYWVAQEQIQRARGLPESDVYKPALAALAHDLTPAQRDEAIRNGTQIAQAAQAGDYWRRK